MTQTRVVPCTEEGIACAAELLRKGEVVGIPTETVYGLAANAFDRDAVGKIFLAKGRPQDNPLIVHISDLSMLDQVAREFPENAKRLADAFWPGPLTMILRKADSIPAVVTAGLDTVGIRMPSHPGAAAVIRESGLPLAAPSANLSGRPSPTKAEHVFQDLKGRIPLILDGGRCEVGVESTVVLVRENGVRILRPGGVTAEMIREAGIRAEMDPGVEKRLEDGEKVLSPGLKYRHYSPKASVVLVQGRLDQYAEYVREHAEPGVCALVFEGEERIVGVPCVTYGKKDDPSAQAADLFDALREVDRTGAKIVYARCPELSGVGFAVYNRLLRAAAFQVVRV